MPTIYYYDFDSQNDVIINQDTLLYLVQCGQGPEAATFALAGMNKRDLEKYPFDPFTCASAYWPISLDNLCDQAGYLRSKFFYYDSSSRRLTLSQALFQKVEVDDLFSDITKRPPVSFKSNRPFAEEEINHLVRLSEAYHCLQNENNSHKLSSITYNVDFLGRWVFLAPAEVKKQYHSNLFAIRKESDYIFSKIDKLGQTFGVFQKNYPHIIEESSFQSIVFTADELAPLASGAVAALNRSFFYPRYPEDELSDETDIQAGQETRQCSAKPVSDISSMMRHCITFFSSKMPVESSENIPYPYNRARIHL